MLSPALGPPATIESVPSPVDEITFDSLDLLNVPIGSARGRRPSARLDFVRELNGADMDMLANPPPQGVATAPLTRLRHTHHMLAKLIAEGRKGVEVAAITGYSQSRISILRHDPAFAELIEYYKGQVEVQYTDVHARLAALGMDTIEELQRRLDENPDDMTMRELMELAQMTLDRSSAPPRGGSKQSPGGGPSGPVQVLVNFHAPAAQAAPEVLVLEALAGAGSDSEGSQ